MSYFKKSCRNFFLLPMFNSAIDNLTEKSSEVSIITAAIDRQSEQFDEFSNYTNLTTP